MASRQRFQRRRKLAFWVLVVVVVAIWVLLWPARDPEQETIDQLQLLGYQCDKQPDRVSIYVCTDADAGQPTDPATKTSLWLYSPYQTEEAEKLMDEYCPQLEGLWQADLSPTAWTIDSRLLIMPHGLYSRSDLIDQYRTRQAQLAADLSQISNLGQEVELETRCAWYQNEPAGGSLIPES